MSLGRCCRPGRAAYARASGLDCILVSHRLHGLSMSPAAATLPLCSTAASFAASSDFEPKPATAERVHRFSKFMRVLVLLCGICGGTGLCRPIWFSHDTGCSVQNTRHLGDSRRARGVRPDCGGIQPLYDVGEPGDRLGLCTGRRDDQRLFPDPPRIEVPPMRAFSGRV
jgi:hypothetical protein